MAIKNCKLKSIEGLINIENFPRGELIKSEKNKDVYKVPNGVSVLTIWNGEKKWVKPESYSVHKNLIMLSVTTKTGNTVECSEDNTIITVNDKLEYIRTNPKVGMAIPRYNKRIDNETSPVKYLRTINSGNVRFNLNFDMGYLIGVIIGDGWVNPDISKRHNDIMLATIHQDIVDKITSILRKYGYNGNPYTFTEKHHFDKKVYTHSKHTWSFKPLANLLRDSIGIKATNKHLPYWWYNTTPSFRYGLLSGLIDTDGTIALSSANRYRIRYDTTSSKLAYDIAGLLNSLNINSGISIFKRPTKKCTEYIVLLSARNDVDYRKKLKLCNKIKKERLDKVVLSPVVKYTPNVGEEELNKLLRNVNDTDSISIIKSALRLCKSNKSMGYFVKYQYLELYKRYHDFIDNDMYWTKFHKVVTNEDIDWDIIKSVNYLPDITEAYDLTVPPYNTFVLHNGIVVYDTMSMVTVYTEEAIKEIKEKLNSPTYYLGNDNSIIYSSHNGVIEVVLKHMTT